MKIIEMAEATAPLAEYASEVMNEPVIVMAEGKPVAALVPLENADMETISLSTNQEFLSLIERSRARQHKEGGLSSSEMRRRLDLTESR